MAPELVHPVPLEDVPGWVRAMSTTFLRDPEGDHALGQASAYARDWDPERAWGARDRGRWVATLRTAPRMLTVPGLGTATVDLPVDTVTNVTVAATNRREGLMSAMLDDALRAARDRGDAASILIAAEWPIYGRFGYAPAVSAAHYTLRASRPGARMDGEVSRVRQLDRAEFLAIAPSVFAASRLLRPGQIDRSQTWWEKQFGVNGYPPAEDLPHNCLIHEGEGGPDGFLTWSSDGAWSLIPPYGTARVLELATTNDVAYRDLWAYLSGLDILDELYLRYRPVDEPVRWLLTDGRTLVTTQHCDLVWLRLLDVAAALSARRYTAPGELVLEVVDATPDAFASGRYLLHAIGADVSCVPTERTPDLALTQEALASIYLGGFRLHEFVITGGVHEHTPGALMLASTMFSTPTVPWNATWF